MRLPPTSATTSVQTAPSGGWSLVERASIVSAIAPSKPCRAEGQRPYAKLQEPDSGFEFSSQPGFFDLRRNRLGQIDDGIYAGN